MAQLWLKMGWMSLANETLGDCSCEPVRHETYGAVGFMEVGALHVPPSAPPVLQLPPELPPLLLLEEHAVVIPMVANDAAATNEARTVMALSDRSMGAKDPFAR